MIEDGNETVTNCHGLKMKAADGKLRMTDIANTELWYSRRTVWIFRYLVQKNANSYRYAPIHIENQRKYPPFIEVESSMVEWENDVVFDTLSETVEIDGFYDTMGIELILERMKELNFN